MDSERFIPKGAVYFPSRAFNAYQTYRDFRPEEIRRDFGYAEQAGINAIRLFLSYEYWLAFPEQLWEKFDTLLELARQSKIRVMPILFENCGRPSCPENAQNGHPLTAACMQSPGRIVTGDPALWEGPLSFVDAFMKRYAGDDRLLAIEVMNEPNENSGDLPFARRMTQRAFEQKKQIPLTIGCIHLYHNLYFAQWIDVYQFHENFPGSVQEMQAKLMQAAELQRVTGKQVWLTEWQRVRTAGPGWDSPVIPQEDTVPELCSLADAVYGSGLGNFFWSLMLKPAYLPAQRPNGTFNGLFHEDGKVYSLQDYRAVCRRQDAEPAGVLATRPAWFTALLEKSEKER